MNQNKILAINEPEYHNIFYKYKMNQKRLCKNSSYQHIAS